MAFLSMLLLAAALSAWLGDIVSPNLLNQPYLIRLRIELLTTALQGKCPHLLEHDKFVGKRDIGGHEGFVMEHNYAVEMQIFDHMQALLEQCYNYLISATPDMSTTTTPITTITTEPTTTTSIPLPSQCTSSATLTLTESWRNNYSGPDPGNDDINILLPGVTWFRFTGAAGNLLKNTCPTKYSCGSSGAYWSNSLLYRQESVRPSASHSMRAIPAIQHLVAIKELTEEELPDVQLTEVELSTSWKKSWIVRMTLFAECTELS